MSAKKVANKISTIFTSTTLTLVVFAAIIAVSIENKIGGMRK
jgi:hypothetical protein